MSKEFSEVKPPEMVIMPLRNTLAICNQDLNKIYVDSSTPEWIRPYLVQRELHKDMQIFKNGLPRSRAEDLANEFVKELCQKDGVDLEKLAKTHTDCKTRFPVLTWQEFKSREQAEINMHKRLVKELEKFFGAKLENIKQYMCAIGPLRRRLALEKNPNTDVIQISTIIGEKGIWYTPDLIAKKDGEMFVTEIKANTGINYLKGQKLEGLLLAKKCGFVPMVITLNVSIGATHLSRAAVGKMKIVSGSRAPGSRPANNRRLHKNRNGK